MLYLANSAHNISAIIDCIVIIAFVLYEVCFVAVIILIFIHGSSLKVRNDYINYYGIVTV